jgi:predicted DNA-binding transcriptional regulator YafY
MLLQARGRMTAGQLAAELEVSERTIYRDIDALSVAGVPIYADRGRDGGYALLDSYRTTLTGLTGDEVRALFMLSIPAPLDDLGMSGRLKAAMRKLAAALPEIRRDDEARVRQRFHLDASWWFQGQEPIPHLSTVYDAVWLDRRLYIRYRLPLGQRVDVEQVIDPYGLVAKASVWYVVYGVQGRIRARRLSRLLDARMLQETFQRPVDFDLSAFWEAWCAEYESGRPVYTVRVRVAPQLAPELAWHLGQGVRGPTVEGREIEVVLPDEEGWVKVELAFESLEQARGQLLALGGAVEVLAPEALRLTMADYGRQIVKRYD